MHPERYGSFYSGPPFQIYWRMEQQSNVVVAGSQLDRALDILELLAGSPGPRGLADIAEQVRGPKATVHRLLAMLQARGYATQDPRTGRTAPGSAASSWAACGPGSSTCARSRRRTRRG